jgi:amino acid transporter
VATGGDERDGASESEDGRDEHQELVELLNELRVVLPGVQVLFAFLLTIPFTGRFKELSTFQDSLFAVSFLSAALALVFLMTPTAYHRIRFRAGDDEAMLRISNRLTIVGLACLAVSLEAAVILVGDLVPFRPMAAIAGAVVGLLLVGLWFVLPLARAARDRRS